MPDTLAEKLLDAALPHVPFDGWSDETFAAAADDVGVSLAEARTVFARGGLDMAAVYHKRADQTMVARMVAADLSAMKYSEKVAAGVRFRLEAVEDKEVLRRGVTLFSLPKNAAEGAQLVWGTADCIWQQLGDTSDDFNWYSKRAILSGVYGSTVLFWLGDTSDGHAATWAFLDRRIGDVMRIEKLKSQIRATPAFKPLLSIPDALLGRIAAPSGKKSRNLPGHWTERSQQ